MTPSQMVAQNLLFLRRYARALTGDPRKGDAYVAATLNALNANRSALQQGSTARVALYRLFSELWNTVVIDAGSPTPAEVKRPPERRLEQITPLPRQAFLLTAVEGFTEAEAAEILGLDADTVAHLIEQSGRELAADIATDILIIEDEPEVAGVLEDMVQDLGHRVVGIARSHATALLMAKAKQPGLILADIRLANGDSGLEVVDELLKSFQVPVVFITGYPERFLGGERPEPAFLLTKPFKRSTLAAVISQALFFEQKARRAGELAVA